MAELVVPDTRFRISFLAAMSEFADEGRTGDRSMVGMDLRDHGPVWHTEAGFAAYVEGLLANSLEETPRPAHFVPDTTLWWAEGDEYVGRVSVRHRLNDNLRELIGHIGYDIRRSRRREGHATALLGATLPVARGLGIDSALVTCDIDNLPSRKVIEANGGVLEDERRGKLRFWVPTD